MNELEAYPLIAKVALDLPLRVLFDYTLNAEGPMPQQGMRVRVPFGEQTKVGVIAACATEFFIVTTH